MRPFSSFVGVCHLLSRLETGASIHPPGDSASYVPPAELAALQTVYESLGGEAWVDQYGWDGHDDIAPCSWFGVECSHVSSFKNKSHVTGLTLPHNNLRGAIPESITNLTFLESVDFSNGVYGVEPGRNIVSGSLVPLCGLVFLEEVALSYNNISGPVPSCIGSIAQLRTLELNYNSLSSTMPSSIGQLCLLEELHLRGNRITGSIPETIGSAIALRVVDFTSVTLTGSFPGPNNLTGTIPRSMCNLVHLATLQLQFTSGLHGTVPDCLGGSIKTLSLQGNQLSGGIPTSLCAAENLTFFYAYSNNLGEMLPPCIGSLPKLEGLLLNTNEISGSIPASYCGLKMVSAIRLDRNQLTGTIPDCWASAPRLLTLGLSINDLSGPIPQKLPLGLTGLYLTQSGLSGTIPDLGLFHQLVNVELNNNDLTGTVGEWICSLPLQFLYLNNNQLSGTLPACMFTSFPDLQTLFVHNNQFGGDLSFDWDLPSLNSLVLSNNHDITGKLPPRLFQQINLVAIAIEGTSISGSLPAALCNASKLQIIALSGNRLTGEIPECLYGLQFLSTLHLASNDFVGTLSTALGNLTALQSFDVGDNRLQGHLPTSLGDISKQLIFVSVQLNRFSCNLPKSIRSWVKADLFETLHILEGNLFGCNGGQFSMSKAHGLQNANEQEFSAYNCGNVETVLSLSVVAATLVPLVFVLLANRKRLELAWGTTLEWRVDWSLRTQDLKDAQRELRFTATGIVCVALASLIMFAILKLTSSSVYSCEYFTAASLAGKEEQIIFGASGFSGGVGATAALGLVVGMLPWWRRVVERCNTEQPRPSSRNREIPAIEGRDELVPKAAASRIQREGYPDGNDSYTDPWMLDAERHAEAHTTKPWKSVCWRGFEFAAMFLLMLILVVGPNVAYVRTALSGSLSVSSKRQSELGITVAKVIFTVLVVPQVARLAAHVLIPQALDSTRFRVRILLATLFSALSSILAPVADVALTDRRCLMDYFVPDSPVTTLISIPYCVLTSSEDANMCLQYGEDEADSTYSRPFEYSGERCVAAVITIYQAVFVASVLLSAIMPAMFEILVVPYVAPWCFREAGAVARAGKTLLKGMSWNASVFAALSATGERAPWVDLDTIAQRVVERAVSQMLSTLLVALTFGLSSALVGVSCGVTGLIQLLHHSHVLGQVVKLGLNDTPVPTVPNLCGCFWIPGMAFVIIAATTVLFWGLASIDYMKPLPFVLSFGSMSLAGLVLVVTFRMSGRRANSPRDESRSTLLGLSLLLHSAGAHPASTE